MANGDSVRLAMAPLAEPQLDRLHEASMQILSETGVNVHRSDIRATLQRAGASVHDNRRVCIPERLVNDALASAPSRIDLYDRQGDLAMALTETNLFFGLGSDLEFTIDLETGARRKSTLADVARAAQLCETLDNIDFVMSFALPSDVSGPLCEVEQFRAMLENTRKPVIMTQFSGIPTAEKMHQLACESCGGPAAFRDQPNYIMYGQFASPLQHEADALDRLVFCAENRIPLIYVPTIMMGASGPVTLAGALALANAECLAGLVMHQLRSPGAPFIYGGCVSPLDMRTTVYTYGSPEWRMADVVLSQLSLRYHLPIFGTGGATDAKAIDAQAGAEWAYSLLACALAGTNLIHDVGYRESGLTGSLEGLVICDEIIGMVKKMVGGLEINDETLARECIRCVGPAGHFVAEDHTRRHFREDVWYPSVFERDRFRNWQKKGCKTLVERARARAMELLGL